MACSTTPQSCLDPVNIFAGVFNPYCGGFADPSRLQAERAVFKSAFVEQINNYGVDVSYYINGFNLSACNILYGEHTTQEYSDPFVIRAFLELEESVSLSRFGMISDDELTMYIAIDTFTQAFTDYLLSENLIYINDEADDPIELDTAIANFLIENSLRPEPKSDDLVEITSLGCDRPGNRGAKIFRITEALDQSVNSGINPVMGHYVWKITAKRYESSMETNAPQELGNDQVYDNAFSGKASSSIFPTISSPPKVYQFDIDSISKNSVFDMSKDDSNVYGTYY